MTRNTTHPDEHEPARRAGDTATYAVIACSDCSTHWVVPYNHAKQRSTTTECRGCGKQHTGKQRVLGTADTQSAAYEERGRILAANAGYEDEYANTPEYADATQHINDTSTTGTDAFTGEPADTITTHREQYSELVANTDPTGKHAFEDAVENTDPIGKHAFEDEVNTALETRPVTPPRHRSQHADTPIGRHPTPGTQVKENTTRPKDINNTAPHGNAGLTATKQRSTGTVTVNAHQPVTDLWQHLTSHPAVQQHFIRAVKTITDRDRAGIEDVLNATGITETPLNGHGTRTLFHWVRKNQAVEHALWELLRVLRELGTGHSTTADIHAAARIFQFADADDTPNTAAPTIDVEIDHDTFTAMPRTQRVDVCEVIGTLSKAFDIRMITTRITRAYLRTQHREHLPGVSEWTNAHQGDSRIDDALTHLDADSVEIKILRALAAQPGETLSYHAVYANVETSRSRARQCISTLKDYGLVESFNPDTAKKLSLLNDGREVLTHMDEHHGQQITLENSVSGTPKSPRHKRVNHEPPRHPPTVTGNSNRTATATGTAEQQGSMGDTGSSRTATAKQYRTAFLNRADHAAIGACGVESGSVTVVDDGVEGVSSETRFVSFDADRSEAVVSVHATNPLDYSVSVAVALASPRLIDAALDERAVEAVLDEVPAEVLRNARQIGYLSKEVLGDAGDVRDMLVQWGEDVAGMTRELHRKDEGQREYVGEIVREAHGLAGSIVHLLDAAGVDLVRDVRVPGKVNSGKVEALAESIAHSVFVQSRYESRVAYRELFEEREVKRESRLGVDVDAADPFGSMIGSFVVRGGSARRLCDVLEDELSGCEPHEDAAEFSVPVPFREVSREVVAETAARVLGSKNLRVTRDVVSVLDAVVDSPFGVAKALQQLARESEMREMDAAELRYALRQLTAGDVLSGLPGSVAEIVMVLVDADRELLQKTVAERVGVSTVTVRNHADVLEATGLVRRGPDGSNWRFVLSFRSERGDGVVPVTCSKSVDSVVGAVIDAVEEGCSCSDGCVEAVRGGRRAGGCVTGRWCCVAARLSDGVAEHGEGREVMIGVEPGQKPIVESAGDSDGDSVESGGGASGGLSGGVGSPDFSGVSIPGASE